MSSTQSAIKVATVSWKTFLTTAFVALCALSLLQNGQEQKTVMAMLQARELPPPQVDVVHESSIVYAGREYTYKFSGKLFSEANDHTLAHRIPKVGARKEESLPSIVFGVCSFGPAIVRRNLIRKTWGSIDSQVFFIIANPPLDGEVDNFTSMLMDEFEEYGDIIWVDIPEHYKHALTPKTFAFQHFANHHYLVRMDDGSRAVLDPSGKYAKTVDYIFKTDDDVFRWPWN
ncbi:MAG: hypothetical protein SGARI_000334 [Bacillariaceae sp.]